MKRASRGLRRTEKGMLHLKRPSFVSWLLEQGILHLKRPTFGLWLKERALLHLKCASCGLCPTERENNTFKERFLLFKAQGTRNITFEARFFF